MRTAFPDDDGSLRPMSLIVGGPDWMNAVQFNIDARTVVIDHIEPPSAN